MNVSKVNTSDVTEGSGESTRLLTLVVDNERASAVDVTSVSGLTLALADSVRSIDTVQVRLSSKSGEEGYGVLGLEYGINVSIGNDQRNLSDLFNAVTTGQNKRGEGRGRQSRDGGITTLSLADLDVPSSPHLSGSKHASTTTHVTEGTLARSVSTTSCDTGDTRDGSTSTPTLSGSLLTSNLGYGVWLTVVLVHAGVNTYNNVTTDGGSEDSRKLGSAGLLSLRRLDSNERSRRLNA